MSLFFALLGGIVCGALFKLVRLPIPAPETLEGILGIIGIVIGYVLLKKLGI